MEVVQVSKDKFISWMAMKKIDNPSWRWDCSDSEQLKEVLQLLDGRPKAYFSKEEIFESLVSSIWGMKIIHAHYDNVFFNITNPEIYKNDERLALVTHNSTNDKIFHNISEKDIQEYHLNNLDTTLYDVKIDETGRLCYAYKEEIQQSIIDFDDQNILIYSDHTCFPYWNSKIKKIIRHQKHDRCYLVENLGSIIVVKKLIALGLDTAPEKDKLGAYLHGTVSALLGSLNSLKKLDSYGGHYYSEIKCEVSM